MSKQFEMHMKMMQKYHRDRVLRGEFEIGYKFELKEEHVKLLQELYFQFDESYYEGFPCVGAKRPFGNSYIEGDIAYIIGYEGEDPDEFTEEESEYLLSFYRELHIVLKIVTQLKTFDLGVYEYTDFNKWSPSKQLLRRKKINSVLDENDDLSDEV